MEVGIGGENRGGNWRWEWGLAYLHKQGPGIREVEIEEGMEVWEGSLHCLDEITLQIPITTYVIVESDQHGPEHS